LLDSTTLTQGARTGFDVEIATPRPVVRFRIQTEAI